MGTIVLNLLPICVFIGIIILIIWQPAIRIPRTSRHLQIDYGIAPLLGVLFLLATLTIQPEVIVLGVLGNPLTPQIRPVMILVLFFSLAYVCISIDSTGFFGYLALLAAKKSGTSGKKLFFYFFLLSSVLTTFTSNDIVILTITPIILYFTKYTKLNPIPYLIGQFFAANIWSIALYVGNPTNIIVAQAYGLTFLEYSIWMALPTVIAGITCFYLLSWIFKKEISQPISVPEIDPQTALKDKTGAIFGVSMLGANLAFLSIAPILGIDMGLICLGFALIMLARDLLSDLNRYRHRSKDSSSNNMGIFRTTKTAATSMPWKIAPFVICMFIMVESLRNSGWIDLFASAVGNIEGGMGLVPSIFFMGFLSSIACNVMNNQPMTILFTEMLQSSAFTVNTLITRGSMYALIMGSNFGANFTLIGALAGIMWSGISKHKDVNITYKQFAKYGFLVMPLIVGLACAVLALEFVFWN